MFDIGFGELLLVAVLGLLVLGPERLPVAVRQTGLWIGRIKRMFRKMRADIEREVGADDIRQQLHNEDVLRSLDASKEEIAKLSGAPTIHSKPSDNTNHD
jgi:sec-independent protein translocase protein TatB